MSHKTKSRERARNAARTRAAASDAPAIAAPELSCYPLWPNPPALVPARPERDWMDATPERFAYRCIPLSIANASGWELSLPFGFEAAWYGGAENERMQFRSSDPRIKSFVTSHFGSGIMTFHTGWLFRTSPGWAVWARGSPNTGKDGIVALDGLVETDWLPFPFTMNWRFLKPGVVRFEAGEPFCFITLAPHGLMDGVQPRVGDLAAEPDLKAALDTWAASRADFSKRLLEREETAVAERWQRTYVQGRGGIDDGAPAYHLSKRRLKPPA